VLFRSDGQGNANGSGNGPQGIICKHHKLTQAQVKGQPDGEDAQGRIKRQHDQTFDPAWQGQYG
jgi:hypothetical protein